MIQPMTTIRKGFSRERGVRRCCAGPKRAHMIHYSRFGGDLSRSRGLVHDFFPATSVRRPVRRRTGWPGLMIGTQRERARGYRRGVRGVKLFGLMMVRNEADIIQLNILHHLAAGVDCFLVVDNGSTDGTDRILDRLSRRLPLVWTRYEGPYYQWDITTQLAREAYLRGRGLGRCDRCGRVLVESGKRLESRPGQPPPRMLFR